MNVEDRRTALRMQLSQSLVVLPAIFGAGIVAATTIYLRHGGIVGWVWLAAIVALLAFRRADTHRNLARLPDLDDDGLRRLARRQTLSVGATGALWGSVVLFFPAGDPYVDFPLAAMWMGMAGSAVHSMSTSREAFPVYALTSMTPMMLITLLVGTPTYLVAGVGGALFIVVLLVHHRRAWQATMATIRLTRENAELAAQLHAEKQAVEEASRAKSLFLSGVSHDLKHPLQALSLYLGYLKALPEEKLVDEGLGRAIPGMESALAGMGGLLGQLLNLSRLESGDLRPTLAPLAVRDVFDELVVRFGPTAETRHLRLRVRPWATNLVTDRMMFQSILDNLVANALRYTTAGGVLVALRRRRTGLRLDVIDTGCGIEADHLPLIFEAYRRFDDRKRSGDEGFGLGLAMVRKQCELLGASIDVASRPGRGSRFTVNFPSSP